MVEGHASALAILSYCCILVKLVCCNEVFGEVYLHSLALCLGYQFLNYLGSFLIKQGLPNLHPPQLLEEGKSHSSSNDHQVHFVQQVANQLDLIVHLSAREEEEEEKERVEEEGEE